jgi:hypothetical protein
MQLDQHRIAIRERSYLEVLDLSLRVAASHAAPLAAAFVLGILPLAILNAWLLFDWTRYAVENDFPAGYLWWMVVLVLWETPVATAPATLYLGQVMFMQQVEPARLARSWAGSLPQLFFFQVVVRGLLMLPVITWFVPASFWPYLNEIILLERNPLRAGRTHRVTTYRRMTSLHGGMGGDLFGCWLASILIGAALLASLWLSMWFLAAILLDAWAWEGPAYTVYFPLALWMVVALFTVARFLGYLNLRIRREGWEVELLMRAEEARLTRQWT